MLNSRRRSECSILRGVLLGFCTVIGSVTTAQAAVNPSDLTVGYCAPYSPPKAIELRVNDLSSFIPVPRSYGNSSNQTVTFSATMNANSIFGPGGVIRSKEVPAGLEVVIFDDGIWATPSTPVTTDRVIISVTSNATGNTILAKCEYDVTVRRFELCNGIDDDGDGRIDEDPGSCVERYLFVPLCWRGTDAAFAARVENSMHFFYNRMRLQSCTEYAMPPARKYWHAAVYPSQHNWCPPNGVAEDQPDMSVAMAQVKASGKADLREYDTIMFITDTPPATQCTGGYTDMKGMVFSRSGLVGEWSIFTHEYGHIVQLSDEYFDPPVPEFLNPATGRGYNRVTGDLGCDPQACCKNSHPCPAHNGRVCLGNLATKLPATWQWGDPTPTEFRNGRCIMSNGSAPGSETSDPTGIASERDWCRRCITRLNDAAPHCNWQYQGQKRRLELNGHVSATGAIALTLYDIADGRVGIERGASTTGETQVIVTDSTGQQVDSFPVATAGGEPGSCSNSGDFWRRKPVAPDAHFPVALQVYKGGVAVSRVTAGGSAPNAVLAGAQQECSSPSGTPLDLDASSSSDPDGDSMFFKWDAPVALSPEGSAHVSGTFPPGSSTVTVTVSDGTGASSAATAVVEVVDTTGPVLEVTTAPAVVRCDSGDQPTTINPPVATDACSSTVTVSGRVIGSSHPMFDAVRPIAGGKVNLPIGRHTVEWTATDEAGNQTTISQIVDVWPAMAAMEGVRSASNVWLTTTTGRAAVAALGSQGIWIEPDTAIGDALSQGPIELRDRVSIRSAFAAGAIRVGQNVSISGGVHGNLSTWFIPRLEVNATFPAPSVGWIKVEPGRSLAIAPGSYGDVTVASNATLFLESAVYMFRSLTLEPGSKVSLPSAGHTRIMIESQAILRGAIRNQPRVALGYFGTSELQIESAFSGKLYAPNARVSVKKSGGGSITAKGLNFEPGVTYQCRADEHSATDWLD